MDRHPHPASAAWDRGPSDPPPPPPPPWAPAGGPPVRPVTPPTAPPTVRPTASPGEAPSGDWARGPRPERARVRWGLGDFAWVWVAGFVGAAVAVGVVDAASSGASDVTVLVASMIGQFGVSFAVLWWLVRWKGAGGLVRDLGLRVRARDWWWVLVGVGAAVANSVLVAPLQQLLDHDRPPQEVVDVLQDGRGALVVVAALLVAFAAPVLEEALYRGVLLRGIARRTTTAWAIALSSATFGAVHLLGNPDAVVLLVGLTALGGVSAWQASRTGELSRSILLHVGFNLVASIVIALGAL